MPRQTIAGAAYALLADRRAATSEELAEPIVAAGLTKARSPVRAVSGALGRDPRFRRLSDRRWAVPEQLFGGTVFTHRPTEQEIDNDVLSLVPDLAPLMALGLYGTVTVEGELLTPAWDADAQALTGIDTDSAIKGPPHWLGGAGRKTLLHVRLEGRTVSVAWGPEPAAATRMSGRRIVEAVRRELDLQPRSGTVYGVPASVSLSEALQLMLVDDPELLHEPLTPLGTLFEEAGLETHRGWVGYRDTDWEALDEFLDFDDIWGDEDPDGLPFFDAGRPPEDDLSDMDPDHQDEELTAALAEQLGLSTESVKVLEVVMGTYEFGRRGQGLKDPQMLASLAALMSDPEVASILAILAGSDADLEPFVAGIEQAASNEQAAGPRFVLAGSAEARDDVKEAERQLRAALDADSEFAPAAIELARYETDRGRYGEALRLLTRTGVPPDDPERAWLEETNQSALPKVGRNERCPCGSGRKYKVCHLGREGDAGSVNPGRALLHKLWLWLDRPHGRRLIHDLKVEVVPDSDRPEHDDEERDRLEGPILDDIILFDHGELERFLRLHSELLPQHEHELGQGWVATRRSLYEVRSVRPGKGLTVRDLLNDRAEVILNDRALSTQMETLDLLCLRLVPDGADGHTPSAGLMIPRSQRAHVSTIVGTGDPIALLRWVARPTPMPQL